LRSGGIVALERAGARSIVDLIRQGPEALGRVRRLETEAEADVSIGPELLAPLGENVLMIATSGNYLSHLAEMGAPAPSRIHGFLVSPNSLTGSGSVVRLPAQHGEYVDWEGELCVVIGQPCYEVAAAEAARCVFGFTLFNDISARDWCASMISTDARQATAAWRNNILFKQFPTFGPMGPWIVPAADLPDIEQRELVTTLNGQVVQRDRIGHTRFHFTEVISQLSQVYAFAPGDLITLGTPAGVGMAAQPPRFLRPGDEIVVSVDGLGELRNNVV
jgi:2-keto-4-pentenoate hydratase/2-oxohepta-3-ene-1,7-dioic acid hydratase in catechol pathway